MPDGQGSDQSLGFKSAVVTYKVDQKAVLKSFDEQITESIEPQAADSCVVKAQRRQPKPSSVFAQNVVGQCHCFCLVVTSSATKLVPLGVTREPRFLF